MGESHNQTAEVPVSGAELKRAERFARESFVLEGEDAATALAPGTARRRALDAALAEIEQGRDDPSLAWRREYSLMLGLERLLAEEEPHLADGATLSAHQVDALSGTLIALTSDIQESARNGEKLVEPDPEPLPATDPEPDLELELDDDEDEDDLDDDEEDEEPVDDDRVAEDEEPVDWDAAEVEDEDSVPPVEDDPGANRRFWFEHATGAGKTVAAMGFVEASRTGGVLILTHRRNLVEQFEGELRTRGYRDRASSPLLRNGDEPDAGGPVTVETYQWFVRNAGTISDVY